MNELKTELRYKSSKLTCPVGGCTTKSFKVSAGTTTQGVQIYRVYMSCKLNGNYRLILLMYKIRFKRLE